MAPPEDKTADDKPADDKPADDKPAEKEEEQEESPIVKELKQLDDSYLSLEREFEAEERALRKKYQELQDPLLRQRSEILATGCDGAVTLLQLPEASKEAATGTPALKGFWAKALANHPSFRDDEDGPSVLQEWDQPVLEYLKDITCTLIDDDHHRSFKLDFVFAENPYFEETLLSKAYTVREVSPYNGETDIQEIKATPITWKAGQDITVALVKQKHKGGAKNKAKKKEKLEARESVFRNFLGLSLKEGEGLPEGTESLADAIRSQVGEDDEMDDEAIVGFMMERDFELASVIKDNIIPFAVRFYTGEAVPEESDDELDEDSKEDEDEDDDDEDEDEEEEDAPKSKAKSKKATAPSAKAASAANAKKEEECKQQ